MYKYIIYSLVSTCASLQSSSWPTNQHLRNEGLVTTTILPCYGLIESFMVYGTRSGGLSWREGLHELSNKKNTSDRWTCPSFPKAPKSQRFETIQVTSSYSVRLAEWGKKFNIMTRFLYKSTPKDIPGLAFSTDRALPLVPWMAETKRIGLGKSDGFMVYDTGVTMSANPNRKDCCC